MSFKRVVVTGLGSVTPIGNTVAEMWQNLLAGVSGAGPISHFDHSKHKVHFACEVKNYNPADYFEKKEIRKLDPSVQFAKVAARECMADSGLDLDKVDRDKIGVIISSGIGGLASFEDEIGDFYASESRVPRFSPNFVPKILCNIASGHVSIDFGLRGPNFGAISACASSANAIGTAYDMIRIGRATAMVVGGTEAAITPGSIGGFGVMRALSTNNDEYQTASRAFSGSRDGFVMGEGSGCLLIEDLDHAIKRGAKIYAEIIGYGASSDSYHLTAPHPEGAGAILAMQNAIDEAGINPSDIDYINAHGTSTPMGDLCEIKAIKKVFGEHAYNLNISSTKTMTGHLLGASGALESIISVKAIQNNIVPPTINHREDDLDPNIDYKMNFTFNKAQKRKIDIALSNSFGFGGQNACLVFKRYAE